MNNELRCKEAQRVTIVGMVFNLILTLFKFAAGILGHSAAMIADAVHSLSDTGTDIVTLVSIKLAGMPRDKEHPYGHGRIETLATTVIGAVVMFAGFWIGYQGIMIMLAGRPFIPLRIALIAAAVSIVVKEGLYHYTVRAGRRVNSELVIANAWHHRTDAISSVATFIGIGFAMYGYPLADPIAAIVIALLIVKVGLSINWKAIKALIDTIPDEKTLNEINQLACGIEGVQGTHGLKVRQSGSYMLVDIDIEVSPEITVADGHEIAIKVEAAILENMNTVSNVMVHLDVAKDDATDVPTNKCDDSNS